MYGMLQYINNIAGQYNQQKKNRPRLLFWSVYALSASVWAALAAYPLKPPLA